MRTVHVVDQTRIERSRFEILKMKVLLQICVSSNRILQWSASKPSTPPFATSKQLLVNGGKALINPSAPSPSPTSKSSETPKSHLLLPFLSALLYLLTFTESANTADANGQSLLLPPPPSTCHCLAGDDDKFGEDPNPPSTSKANHPNRFMSGDGTQTESKVRGAGVERSENAYCAFCGLNEDREVEIRDFENESITTDLRIV
jgi:hypothetical protein